MKCPIASWKQLCKLSHAAGNMYNVIGAIKVIYQQIVSGCRHMDSHLLDNFHLVSPY